MMRTKNIDFSIFKFINKLKNLLFFFPIIIHSQSGSGAAGILETVVPPSANAFTFSTYGNNQPSLFTGAANFNIPITSIGSGDLKFPVSLGYYSAGVKVDAVDNTVGQTWVLLAGGVISRTVVGESDFSFDHTLPSNYNGTNNDELKNYIYNKYFWNGYNGFNTEYDVFSFNFMGRSGRFYYVNNQFISEEGSDISIKFLAGNHFEITDEKGVRYTFASIEETKYFASTCENKNTRNGYSGPMSEKLKTAWFLTKITTVENKSIYIEYEDYDYGYFPFLTQQVKKPFSQMESYCGSGEGIFLDFSTEYDELCQSRQVNYTKIISRIYSDDFTDGEIVFSYERKLLSDIYYKYLTKILKRIKKNDNSYDKIEEFNLNYLTTDTRRFLQSIGNPIKNENYIFDYNLPFELPKRLSFSQDLWGYFNGENNGYFVPKVEGYKKFGNREANFLYSKNGSLKTILYPTGGRTDIDYEQNSYWGEKKHNTPNPIINFDIDYLKPESIINVSRYTYQKIFNFGNVDPLHPVIISASSNYLSGVNCPSLPIGQDPQNPNRHKISVSLIDAATGDIINISGKRLFYETQTPDIIIFEGEGDLVHTNPEDDPSCKILPNRDYILKVISPTCLELDIEFQTWKATYNYENIPTGGLRIKKLKDISENGELNKTYYYNKYADKEKSSGDIGFDEPVFLSKSEARVYCPNGIGATFPECNFASQIMNVITSSSRDLLFDNSGGSNIYYPNVTISYGGDNRENGYSEHEFIVNRNALISQIHGIYDIDGNKTSNTGWNNGKEVKTTFYKSSGDTLKVIENQFIKEEKKPLTLHNIYIKRNYSQKCSWVEETYLHNMSLGYYFTQIYRAILSKRTTKDYTNGNELTTTTEYFYNNPSHYQLTSQKTIFPDGSYQNVDYSYAHEKGNSYLTGKNIVGVPLLTETKKNGKTISKTETVYPTDQTDANNSTSGLPLPKFVSALDLVTGGMSTEVTYNQYDSKGNILQYTTKNGVSTAIIWDKSQTQPIAKVEGATYAQASAVAGDIVTASDQSQVGYTEANLLSKLDAFRNDTTLKSFQITTYTYKPLIGVTSTTPPSGIREIYIYDNANRLQEVRDAGGKLLKSYEYHYKP